jgi:WD40 repeat protein
MSPVRAESRQLLESPRRQLRSVCKTPYRVLDAPDLADDFYLNLVDWSTTNVLGVGLGSCVYLWTAHNAAVSKLCDLSASGDTISSVAWVQKVWVAFPLDLRVYADEFVSWPHRAQHLRWARSLAICTSTTLPLSLSSAHMPLRILNASVLYRGMGIS